MPVPITALYGSLNAILNVILAANVSRVRRSEKISLGHGESRAMLHAARAHGNNAEFLPLALVLLLIAEVSGGSSMILHIAGGVLLLGRVMHAHGILAERKKIIATRPLG